jgi:copper chaperone CopZ
MSMTFKVEGMHCDACAKRVSKAVESASPGAKAKVDVKAHTVVVEGSTDAVAIAAAITKAGYPAQAA